MNLRPAISIGLFVYNGDFFLPKALDSLLQQTFLDFELIISDNASTDGTEEICRAHAARDNRIRYYRSPKNMGAGWNMRRVCELATGKYFKWAAADDFLDPEFLRRCVEALENDPGCVLAFTGTRVIDRQGNHVEDYKWPMQTHSPDVVTRFREMLLNDHMCYQIFGIMRRDVLNHLPPHGSKVNSDGVLLAQMALLGRFYEVPERLFFSTRHIGQSSQTKPVRVKAPRFRLTNRYGTLPCPEWWDPEKTRTISFPEWRMLLSYAVSVRRAPLRFGQRVRCYLLLAPWVRKHFSRMMKDLLIAADQILYNLQTPNPVSSRANRRSQATQLD
jgi:glycosyltransferase involved in cell wall biosynthesis